MRKAAVWKTSRGQWISDKTGGGTLEVKIASIVSPATPDDNTLHPTWEAAFSNAFTWASGKEKRT